MAFLMPCSNEKEAKQYYPTLLWVTGYSLDADVQNILMPAPIPVGYLPLRRRYSWIQIALALTALIMLAGSGLAIHLLSLG